MNMFMNMLLAASAVMVISASASFGGEPGGGSGQANPLDGATVQEPDDTFEIGQPVVGVGESIGIGRMEKPALPVEVDDSRWDGVTIGVGYVSTWDEYGGQYTIQQAFSDGTKFNESGDGVTAEIVYLTPVLGSDFHVGVEATASYIWDGDKSNCYQGFNCAIDQTLTGSVGGRAGYDFDGILPYLHAGIGYTETELTASVGNASIDIDAQMASVDLGFGAMIPLGDTFGVDVKYTHRDLYDSEDALFGGDVEFGGESHEVRASLTATF